VVSGAALWRATRGGERLRSALALVLLLAAIAVTMRLSA
jgi:hypothetical protein